MTYPAGDYFQQPAPTARTPGELVIARTILIGTGILTILIITLYALIGKVTAQWTGTMIGVNIPNIAGAIFALLIHPGRQWTRWAIIAVAAIRCITITTYYVLPGGLTYATFLLLPAAIILAVNLPAARQYFAANAES